MMICPISVQKGHHIDEFERVDAGGRVGREVADVVRARAAGVQPDRLHAAHKLRRVLGQDEPHLEIRTRGDLHVTGRQFFRDVCEFAKLEGAHQSAGNPQPGHERFLVRRKVKKGRSI
jgi:hypothetical protein